MKQTIIVSNRLPVSIKKGENGLEVYPSAGGLATGLSSYAKKRGNLWIGWPGLVSDDLTDKDRRTITRKLAAYNCAPVFLTKKQIDDFYSGYSNSILWPFLHTMEYTLEHEARYWKAYNQVNEIFAEAVLTLSSPDSTIWVHDYQLMTLPRLLRASRPSDKIGFFLHIPFPQASDYVRLNHASSLIRGLLGADLIGFHTKSYAENFIESALALTGAAPAQGGLALKERAVYVADFPMGIDYVKFSSATKERSVQSELRKLKLRYKGQKIILTVDRLDPTKGFVERLQAYRTLLEKTPELIGKVTMIMLAVPSREEVKAYAKLKSDVDRLVSEINEQFSTTLWKPIHYMYKSVPFEYLSALYQLADVAFVAPIRDGMNLVAKEYIASHDDHKGTLILSQTAGAAQELREALLVDIAKPNTLVKALKRAIKMPPKELKRRGRALQQTISTNNVHYWAGNFMNTLNKPIVSKSTPLLTTLRRTNLARNYQGALRRLVLLDYDGVLAPFRTLPGNATPSPEILHLLRRIARQPGTHLAIVSGRAQADLEQWFGNLPVTLIAEHGGVIRYRNQKWESVDLTGKNWKAILKPALEKHAADTPGAFVEEKQSSLVWHYRSASPYYAQKNIAILKAALKPELKRFGLALYMGNKILEIKNPNITKGKTVRRLLIRPYDFIMAIGDDYTDEDMFRALPRRAYTLKVGPGRTTARYRIKNTAEVEELLKQL